MNRARCNADASVRSAPSPKGALTTPNTSAVRCAVLLIGRVLRFGSPSTVSFYCGNFGCLLLNTAAASKVYPLLRKMVQITSMRGAQSAGIVTYSKQGIAKPIAKPVGPARSRVFK